MYALITIMWKHLYLLYILVGGLLYNKTSELIC